jgi:hypothetical protein
MSAIFEGKLHLDRSEYADWGMIRDDSGHLIAKVSVPIGTNDARCRREKIDPTEGIANRIINAVNCHDDLVDALEAFLDVGNCKASRDMAIAALTKAKGGQGE